MTANGDQDRPTAAARTISSSFFPDGFGARVCRGEDRGRRPPRRLTGPLGRRGDRRPAGLLVVALVAAAVLAVIPTGFAQDALEVDSYTVDATITAGGDSCGFDVREEIAVTFLQDTAGFTWLSTHEIANFEVRGRPDVVMISDFDVASCPFGLSPSWIAQGGPGCGVCAGDLPMRPRLLLYLTLFCFVFCLRRACFPCRHRRTRWVA